MTALPTDADAGVELILRHQGRRIVVARGRTSAELDQVLAAHDAETWVFLPSAKSGEREALEDARTKLPEASVLAGERVAPGTDDPPTIGVFVLDLHRSRAREIAKEWKLERFYWGRRGSEAEEHPVAVLSDDDSDDDDSMLTEATGGLRDLLETLRSKPWVLTDEARETGDAREGRDARLLPLAALAAAGVGVVAHLLTGRSSGVDADVAALVQAVFHPVVLPALLLGLFLRTTLPVRVGDRTSRELTADESLEAWRRIAPRMGTVWLAAAAGVAALTAARLWSAGTLDATELVDDGSTNLLICLWALPPIAYSRSVEKALAAVLGAAIWLFIALLMMKLTLMFAGLGARFALTLVRGLVTIPEFIADAWTSLARVAAELGFLVYMLGYTWTQARKHFVLWASDELPEE